MTFKKIFCSAVVISVIGAGLLVMRNLLREEYDVMTMDAAQWNRINQAV